MLQMKRFAFILFLTCCYHLGFAQLKDIKILIPKQFGYSTYEFVKFIDNEKYFVVCAQSLAVFNTETCEIIDEIELISNARNLSVSDDGKLILFTIGNELNIYSFINQKLQLVFKTQSIELLKGLPNGEIYKAVDFSICFFTDVPNQIYASIGSFSMLFDFQQKKVIGSHVFKLGDYVIHGGKQDRRSTAVLTIMSGTNTSVIKQSLTNLDNISTVMANIGMVNKSKIHDSLLMCFAADKYFILNIDNGKIVHEVRVPRQKYDPTIWTDKKYFNEQNKRTSFTQPDTINFGPEDYVLDVDYNSKNGSAYFVTSKEIKVIDLKTKKGKGVKPPYSYNLKISNSGNRMVVNGYVNGFAIMVFDPSDMKQISERVSQTTPFYEVKMSPNNRWMVTRGIASVSIWDMNAVTKYADIKDETKKDSIINVYNYQFLNDSEVVVSIGGSYKKVQLKIYNIHKRRFTRLIKETGFTYTSGFMNNEFYYCDYTTLHILNLKTMAEEKYEGMFSLAAVPQYNIINFTSNLVFIPDAGKFKIVNRNTKKNVYESSVWGMQVRFVFSPDEKFAFTTSVIDTKKTINGNTIDMQSNAIVRIDLEKKQIVNHYAETYLAYDFKIKDNGKSIGIWYVKYDIEHFNDSLKEVLYTLYDIETAKVISTKTITQGKDIVSFNQASESGKYFALGTHNGNNLKLFDDKGDLIMDLSYLKISIPELFFNENTDRLIITSKVVDLATFIDIKNRKLIGQMANARNDQYFLVTSDLHYMGSKEFIKNIRFKYKTEMFSFEQFDAQLNQPHKVLRAFGCKDTILIKAYETAYLKRLKLLGLKADNELNFASLPTIQFVTVENDKPNWVKFNISASKGKNKLLKLEVYNNGTLVHSEIITKEQENKFDKTLMFETTSGINRYEFIVKDEEGGESPRITRFYNNTSLVKPNLYLAVIASEKFKNNKYDLSYAVKDASDMAKAMANSKSFDKIEIKKMFNQSFTIDSLVGLNSFFSKAGVNDVVMVFFAGHGYLDDDLSYYFPTYYTDFSDPKINSVAYKSFEKMFQSIKPIRKLMFIDACFSGEVDEEGLFNDGNGNSSKDTTRASSSFAFAQSTALEMSKAIFSDLRQNSGATIISSAGGTEAAFEGEKWNNGLFTHCVLEGISNYKADKNHDGKVMLSELQHFVADEVYKLSEGKQSPTYRMENTVLDYELW